jgi:hypothetical protein
MTHVLGWDGLITALLTKSNLNLMSDVIETASEVYSSLVAKKHLQNTGPFRLSTMSLLLTPKPTSLNRIKSAKSISPVMSRAGSPKA